MRPTADRVREAWLSIVSADIAGARVLDLFAGSGALGLEALSRGAPSADFVELAPPSLRALADNIAKLGAATTRWCTAATRCASPRRSRPTPTTSRSPTRRTRTTSAVLVAERGSPCPSRACSASSTPRAIAMPGGGDTRRYGTTADHVLSPQRAHRREPPRAVRSRAAAAPHPSAMRTAIYAGSFDPITRGHQDLDPAQPRVRRPRSWSPSPPTRPSSRCSPLEERVRARATRSRRATTPRVEVRQLRRAARDFARDVGRAAARSAGCARWPTSSTSSRWRS